MFRRRRRALAVVLVCALFGALTIGAPAARSQSIIEYALLVALLQQLGFNDTTPPSITITTPSDGAIYTPGEAVTANYACDDAGVDVLTSLLSEGQTLDDLLGTFRANGIDLGHPACEGPVASGAHIDTTTPGPHSFTVNARDVAFHFEDTDDNGSPDTLVPHPNTSTLTHQYFVHYPFGGFQRPVDEPPASNLNLVKAGQAVPIKFSLGGDRGLGILSSAPTSHEADCDSGEIGELVAPSPAGSSGLQYDAASDTYTWVWKTDKTWAGCRTLTVALDDGTQHTALFMFK